MDITHHTYNHTLLNYVSIRKTLTSQSLSDNPRIYLAAEDKFLIDKPIPH
jgi:hypothetical protein